MDTACADLSIEATNQDRDQGFEQFIEEDNMLLATAIDCISELKRCKRTVNELMVQIKSAEPALAGQVVQLQTQLDQRDNTHRKNQQFKDHILDQLPPKLEIPYFNGDKLRWSE